MSKDFAIAESNRCIYCYDAPCTKACPTEIDVPNFIKQIATNDLIGAGKSILNANPLGYSCAKVCPVEELCVGSCVYNLTHEQPIQIGRLQQYAIEHTINNYSPNKIFEKKQIKNPKRIALIGGGPASIAAAVILAKEGHKSTIFEQNPFLGGLNTYAVASYKLGFDEAQFEINWLLKLGIDVNLSTHVSLKNAESLLDNHDAVFVGIGGGPDRRIPKAIGALELIAQIKSDPLFSLKNTKTAFIVGGGNTAVDAARTLKHLGLSEVTILYRRGLSEMSAYKHEITAARQDGAVFKENAVLENQTVTPDIIVSAIGQEPFKNWKSFLEHPRVWAGGDFANGGAEVVNAVAEAKEAVKHMLKTFEVL